MLGVGGAQQIPRHEVLGSTATKQSERRPEAGYALAGAGAGEWCKKGGPEVRIFGGPTGQVREKTSSFTASLRDSGECGFKYQQFWVGVEGSAWQMLGEQLPKDLGGRESAWRGSGSWHCQPHPEETDQRATRSPPVSSGPSVGSARWAQNHSGHAGVCLSPGLAT